MSLLGALSAQRLVVCVGPGGVGKTTFAAALAVEAAARGRRALVLTIDPARRLAGALGLDGLDDTVREVDVSAVGNARTGQLHAAMLDTRTSYDSLIARIAPSDGVRERILSNRVYRAFSRTLARSHAYVAMERLYDVTQGDEYDLVVLDTPPMRSALEIFDAPRSLSRFLDDRVIRFFLGRVPDPISLEETSPSNFASAAALRVLGAIASRELVEEMVGFFNLFASMREGFSERARRVDELLRGERTSFVLVGSVEPAHLDDARAMRDGLLSRELMPDLVVLNRSYAPERSSGVESGPEGELTMAPVHVPVETAEDRLQRLFPAGDGEAARGTAEVLMVLETLRHTLAREGRDALARAAEFAAELPDEVTTVVLPELEDDLSSLGALRGLVALVDA